MLAANNIFRKQKSEKPPLPTFNADFLDKVVPFDHA